MSSKINNIIVWEKWRDPFLGYDENEIDIENSDIRYMDNVDTDEAGTITHSSPVRVIYTPIGIVPYNEYTASSKIFNFWVGHTKFTINNTIANILENCEGVETLDIFTRYRFRIGIGKIFKEIDVMQDISSKIETYLRYTHAI